MANGGGMEMALAKSENHRKSKHEKTINRNGK